VTLNMPADILRELTRDDASARTTHPAPDMDIPAAEDAVRALLVALGQDPEAEHLRHTPRRAAAAFSDGVAHSGASGNTRTLAKLWAKQIPSGVYRRDVTIAVS
jgi:GTP cyclohydrolase I